MISGNPATAKNMFSYHRSNFTVLFLLFTYCQYKIIPGNFPISLIIFMFLKTSTAVNQRIIPKMRKHNKLNLEQPTLNKKNESNLVH